MLYPLLSVLCFVLFWLLDCFFNALTYVFPKDGANLVSLQFSVFQSSSRTFSTYPDYYNIDYARDLHRYLNELPPSQNPGLDVSVYISACLFFVLFFCVHVASCICACAYSHAVKVTTPVMWWKIPLDTHARARAHVRKHAHAHISSSKTQKAPI